MTQTNAAQDNPVQTRRAAVIVNPMKSSGEDFKAAFYRLCEAEGWSEPLWLETTAEDTGLGQAREEIGRASCRERV